MRKFKKGERIVCQSLQEFRNFFMFESDNILEFFKEQILLENSEDGGHIISNSLGESQLNGEEIYRHNNWIIHRPYFMGIVKYEVTVGLLNAVFKISNNKVTFGDDPFGLEFRAQHMTKEEMLENEIIEPYKWVDPNNIDIPLKNRTKEDSTHKILKVNKGETTKNQKKLF